MPKEKFDRNKPHANIDEIIASEDVKVGAKERVLNEMRETHQKALDARLELLIQQHGEEEGKLRFKEELKQAKEEWELYLSIDASPEPKEENIDISKIRR